jgi:hypothetical protein
VPGDVAGVRSCSGLSDAASLLAAAERRAAGDTTSLLSVLYSHNSHFKITGSAAVGPSDFYGCSPCCGCGSREQDAE